MALVRAVSFEDVDQGRLDQLAQDVEAGAGQPEGVAATEIIVLHDREAAKALVLVFFEDEEDYSRADAVLGAMPSLETPGSRASVTKYVLAGRGTP